jgi:hypothetical protein
MTEAPISPLRRRMIEDMTIRKFAPRTQEGYIRAVMCGRPTACKDFLVTEARSLAVMCPACRRGAHDRWP